MVIMSSLQVADACEEVRRSGSLARTGSFQGPSLDWRLAVAGGAAWAVLAAAATAGALRSSSGHFALPVFLWVYAVLLVAAALLARLARRPLPAPRLHPSLKILFGAFFTLLLQLIVRLFSYDRFGGDWASLDFGAKCGKNVANLAFTVDLNSFGHCLQGCASLLLFPASDAALLHFCRRCPGQTATALIVKEFLALGVVVYPSYNVAKRGVKSAAHFARSSFCNNGAEWASGFALGASAAPLATAACGIAGPELEAALNTAYERASSPCLVRARLAATVVLSISSLASAIMMWLSWDREECPSFATV